MRPQSQANLKLDQDSPSREAQGWECWGLGPGIDRSKWSRALSTFRDIFLAWPSDPGPANVAGGPWVDGWMAVDLPDHPRCGRHCGATRSFLPFQPDFPARSPAQPSFPPSSDIFGQSLSLRHLLDTDCVHGSRSHPRAGAPHLLCQVCPLPGGHPG